MKITSDTIKLTLLYFVFALVLSLLISPVRGGYFSLFGLTGIALTNLIGSIVFYIYTIICLKKANVKTKTLFLLLAVFLGSSLEFPLSLEDYHITFFMHPNIYIKWLAIIAAYLTYNVKSLFIKTNIVVLFLIFTLYVSFVGQSYWGHKAAYGTWTGRINESVEAPIAFFDEKGDSVYLDFFANKYVLLYCWDTSCGYCYKSFPDLQNMYESNKNKNIAFSAVHFWSKKENHTTGYKILKKENYTFPSLATNNLNDKLRVDGFPTVLIFDPYGKLVFRGRLDFARKYLEKIIKKN